MSGLAAQAKLDNAASLAVSTSINRQLPQAMAAHIASTEAVRRIAREVESHVERGARGIITRLANDEVARQSLSSAIEQRCVAQIEQTSGRLIWGSCLLGALSGLAAGYATSMLLTPGKRRST
mmetsp:Transcript_39775/g.105089  ORF Transcript_39775/g.105089 Transcript_39775/m.105089 type:complete len:123 (+) Transcript_39775:373-741(+)